MSSSDCCSDIASQARPELLPHQTTPQDNDVSRSEAKPASSVTKASTRDHLLPSETSIHPQGRNKTELKIVYRTLRLISDWALSGFFTEVCVEGIENVRREGALILTPCHHNEIIDIATLSATIPHRRVIAYWTKASLFKNVVARFILRSAGAIPVARVAQPQASRGQEGDRVGYKDSHGVRHETPSMSDSSSERGARSQKALFDATYKELAKREGGGGVLAVFPEGTSYTMPRIVQAKEGAARAALGYVQWWRDRNSETPDDGFSKVEAPVSVVPVGIVYTDKSRYRSGLYVRYGTPIELQSFIDHRFSEDNDFRMGESSGYQNAVRGLTEEIEKGMFALTINAPDWDTIYAAQTARVVLWSDERSLRLEDFVKVSKILVNLFERPSLAMVELKTSLLRYHALLHHTDLTHAALEHVPFPPPSPSSSKPMRLGPESPRQLILSYSSIIKLLTGLPSLVAPLVLSLPTHVAHTPAYVFGALSSHALASEEEEARAQFKVIFGGLGRAAGTLAAGFAFVRSIAGKTVLDVAAKTAAGVISSSTGMVVRVLAAILPASWSASVEKLKEIGIAFGGSAMDAARRSWSKFGRLGDVIGILGVAWLLCVWHARVIDTNYTRFKRARATLTILQAVLFVSRYADESESDALKPYLVTPPPPINPYIAKSLQSASEDAIANRVPVPHVEDADKIETMLETGPGKPASAKVTKLALVRHLLIARTEAVGKLRSTFCKLEREGGGTPPRGDNSSGTGTTANDVDVHYDMSGREGRQKTYTVADMGVLRECGATFD